MSLSFVVINKHDRRVAHTLAALRDLSADGALPGEIIVVDASSGRLDDIRRTFPDVRWIDFEPRWAKPTIPEQRNVGVTASSGDIVVFVDASCVPDEDWLPRLVAPILEDGECVVAGSHRSSNQAGLRDEAARFLGEARYVNEAPTINLAVRREVFARVGGFDESFHYGSDVDFTWRCVDTGYRIRYVPDARVAHDWGDRRSEIRRSYLYGQARLRLYAKHPGRWRMLLGKDSPALAYPLFILLSPLALSRPRILALLLVPLAKNVRHRPLLTVADHLVYGLGILVAMGQRLRAALASSPGP